MAFKDKNKWRGSVTIQGKRYTKTFLNKKLAEIWEAQTKLAHEKKSLSLNVTDTEPITKLIGKYLKSCQGFKKSSTVTREKYSLTMFQKFCEKHVIITCGDLDKGTWKEYIEFRKDSSTRTINLDLQTINKMFQWGIEEELITNNPMICFKIHPLNDKVINYTPIYLSDLEI